MTVRSPDDPSTPFHVLGDSTRRYLLSRLLEAADPGDDLASVEAVSVDVLARDVASLVHSHPIVTDEQVARVRVELVHRHLPHLESAGIVTCEEREGSRVVSTEDHPVLEHEWVRTLLDDPSGGVIDDERVLDRTLEALQTPRRHTVCAVLARRRGRVPVTDLATMVVAEEDEVRIVDVSASDAERTAIELVHGHLPALADAGLVRFDRDDRTAAISLDAPQWRAAWLAEGPLESVVERLEPAGRSAPAGTDGTATESDRSVGCWTIDGAERVIARGQQLADLTDDELFVTVPDDGLIQHRCLERWHAAVERGVDLYVGSRSPAVRERVRETIPDATICEPRFDWLNLPVDHLEHGRMVFSDRERVMLVSIDETAQRDVPDVTAITGSGSQNALVSLVREHVGPRLDRLERERDDGGRTDGTTALPM
ncbi:DUF7344 domain-containing protein [Halopiger goleimassiliensis]|uniref:DUF7344 domain-containing protein n=1 Tax=Halopiger goleimassiliensis TaxID=1293048 RepID=UPI0006781A14|nr:hypothetical protein [Halopiger goleimassiliensis]